MKTISLIICFFLLLGWGRLSDGALDLDAAYSSADQSAVHTKPKAIDPSAMWPLATPAKAGFQGLLLQTAVDTIGRMEGVYSLLVVRDGYLVVERYFREGYREKPHNLKSASKSVLSALTGIAIDEGSLRLDQPICDLLPQCKGLTDPRKALITVRHLLSMTSGLTPTSYQSYNGWVLNGDWVQAVLDQTMVADPGTHHQYSTGDTHLLSAVLTAATGMSTRDYAIRKLLAPMNVTLYGWDQDPQGIYQGGNNLSLIPLDFAKIGQLYLEGGRYKGRQIVPKAWVEASTRISRLGKHEVYGTYGFLWYLRPGGNDAFVAVGYGGQYLYVSPAEKTVIVVTATLESKGKGWEKELFRHIQDEVLGSVQRGPTQLVQATGLDAEALAQPDDRAALGQARAGRTRSRLNLRRGPGKTYRVVKTLDPGTVLKIKEQRDAWLRVEAGNLSGWVSGDYVRITPSDAVMVAKQAEEETPAERKTTPAPAQPAVQEPASPDEAVSPVPAAEEGRATLAAKPDRAREAAEAKREEARKALTSELATARERIETLSRALETAEADKADVTAGLAPLARELKAQQEILHKGATDRQQLGQDLAGVRSELEQMEQKLLEQKSENQALVAQLTKTGKELESQSETTARSEKARETLASELTAMQGRIVSLGDTVGAVLGGREELQGQVSALREELAAERESGARGQEAQRTLGSELNTAREELRILGQGKQEALDQAAQAQAQLGQELTTLRAQMAAMEKNVHDQQAVSSKLAAVTGDLETQRQVAARLETAREGLVSEMAEARGEIQALRATRQAATDAAGKAQAQLGEEIASLRTQLAEMDMTVRDQQGLSVKLAKVTEELETQRRTATSFQNTRESFAAELSGVQNQNSELGAALQRAEVDRGSLKAEISALRDELASERTAAKQANETQREIETELASARSELKALQESRQAAGEESASVQKELSQEVASLRTQVAAMEKTVSDQQGFTAKLASLTEALENQRRTAADSKGARESLTAELASAKSELKALRESRQAAEDASASVQKELSQEVTSLRTQVAEMEKTVSDQQGFAAKLASLTEALENQRRTASDFQGARESLTAELASAKSELKALQESRQAAEDASASVQKELSQEVTSLRTQVAEMEKTLSDPQGLSGKLAGLTEELATQRRIAASFETVRDALLADLGSARKEIRSLRESRQEATEEAVGGQDRLAKELTAVRAQLQVMEEAFDQQQSDRQAFHAELAKVAQELGNQRDAAAQSEAAGRELIAELAQVRDQNTLLADTLKAVRARREDLKTELAALHSELATQREAGEKLQVAALPGKTGQASAGDPIQSIQALLQTGTSSPPRAPVPTIAAAQSGQPGDKKAEPVAAVSQGNTLAKAAPIPPAPVLSETVKAATITTETPELSAIDSFVHSWAANWAGQNLEAYLSHYAKTFQPPGRVSLNTWYIQREKRLLKPSYIEIIIGSVQKTRIGESRARATFEQEYRSDGYGDRVVKTLDLVWENGKWGIVKESSRPL